MGSWVTEFDCFMVTFLSRLLSRPPANGMGIRLGGRHACLLLVIGSLCGIWQQSQSMHSECQPPLTRVRCFRRAATPPHGLSEIPQGKSCAFRDKAYMRDGHLALLPASTTLRGWRSALQHPWPAPLPRRPRQVVGDGARPCTSKQAATRCVRYSTRGNGSYGYKINDNGRSALTTSLLLAAIEMEPALVAVQPFVHSNSPLERRAPAIAKRAVMLPHIFDLWPTDGELSFVAGDCAGNNGIDEQHGG
jgi:hypothetical protein